MRTFISNELVPAGSILIVNNVPYSSASVNILASANTIAFVLVAGDPGWEELRAAIGNPTLAAVSVQSEFL
jgi:hypothetical protein